MPSTTDAAVRDQAIDQLVWHWEHQVRPRLVGLTDDEYRWEPVDDCWSVVPRADARTEVVGGRGEHVAELAFPEPVPPPVTTIAWRLAHLIVGVFGVRAANHFGAPATDFLTHDYSGSADGALHQLDAAYGAWVDGVRSMPPSRLWEPIGETEGAFADAPYLGLVLHINREAIHHGAEILLLRDLYRRLGSAPTR